MSMTISPSKFGSSNYFHRFSIENVEDLLSVHFRKPHIPYTFNALEPIIDTLTLRTHFLNLHMNSYDQLCDTLGCKVETKTIESIFNVENDISDHKLSNAGSLYNHQLYWDNLSPYGGELGIDLQKAITDEFKSTYTFKLEFLKKALQLESNGWVWLVLDDQKKLKIVTTDLNINPLMTIAPEKGIPILAIDLWEHAFYSSNICNKNEYLRKIWMFINWNEVSNRYRLVINKM
jgi:superoxide dismutase, Fe-Mn family